MQMIAGFERADAGRIPVDGIDLADVPLAKVKLTQSKPINH